MSVRERESPMNRWLLWMTVPHVAERRLRLVPRGEQLELEKLVPCGVSWNGRDEHDRRRMACRAAALGLAQTT
jgi:hypothetical protein